MLVLGLNLCEAMFLLEVQDHQSSDQTLRYCKYAIGTFQVPEPHCLLLCSGNI